MLNKIKSTLSIFLVVIITMTLLCVPVIAEQTNTTTETPDTQTAIETTKIGEGLIIKNTDSTNPSFLFLDGSIVSITAKEKDVLAFCNTIANSGVKVYIYFLSTTEATTIDVLGVTTAKALPSSLQKKWEAYLQEEYGLYSELEGVVTKDGETYSFVANDKILSPMKFEYEDTKVFADIIANKGITVKVESAVYNDDSILIGYIESKEPLPEKELKDWQEYLTKKREENTKVGVIVSYGSSSYMLVEKDTNKMYYLTTTNETIYTVVPVIADKGYELSLVVTPKSENVLYVEGIDTRNLPEELLKDAEAAEKKRFESVYYNVEGYITLDGTDYNIHYNNDKEKIGLQTNIEDVAKVIKCVADDKDVKLKFEGFINYEQTVMDVRKVTFLTDLTEGETLKKLQEAFPEQKQENNAQNNSTQQTNNTQNQNQANTSANNNVFNDATFSEMYNSFFGNSTNNTTSDFSALFGDTTTFNSMQELFNRFNAQSPQTQTELLNSANMGNFDFAAFQNAFNNLYSQSGLGNTTQNTSSTTPVSTPE